MFPSKKKQNLIASEESGNNVIDHHLGQHKQSVCDVVNNAQAGFNKTGFYLNSDPSHAGFLTVRFSGSSLMIFVSLSKSHCWLVLASFECSNTGI